MRPTRCPPGRTRRTTSAASRSPPAPSCRKLATDSTAAQIYIDSPRRPGSGCPAGSGTVRINGTSSREAKLNTGRYDSNVWVLVDGTKGPGDLGFPAQDIIVNNRAHIDAVWYAPDSHFHLANEVNMHGGAAAYQISMNTKVTAKLDVGVQSVVGPGTGLVSRRGWFECTAVAPVASDPESGC